MIDDLAAIAKCGAESVILNALINAKISMKRMEFNKTKCVKLHISKEDRNICSKDGGEDENMKNMSCVFLEAQDFEMKSVNQEKYIGDVISSNGSNDANVSRRRSIGMGAIAQIFSILKEISLGHQYIEIGLILRESILLSKMLLSAEAWHKVYQYQIEKLEEVDKIFYRKLFNSHSKTGIEFFYSESGTIPLRIRISLRRLLYWWHILHVDKAEMIYRVYLAQKLSPVAGDWVNLLEKDKEEFQIKISDEEISETSKLTFKNYVKSKAKELTIQYLENLQKKKSKSKQLDMADLTTSPYLLDKRFSKEERELLFKLRSRTVQVKDNFKQAYLDNNMLCELCQLFPCTQAHPLQCPKLTVNLIVDRSLNLNEKFIFGTTDQQLLYIKIYKEFWD